MFRRREKRKTFRYFGGLLDFMLACDMQALLGRAPGGNGTRKGKKQRTWALEDSSMVLRKVADPFLEAVLQQRHRTTKQLRTGRASNPGKRQE